MKTLTLQIPESVDEKEVKMELAVQLYTKKIMSIEQASQLVGISVKDFEQTIKKEALKSEVREAVEELQQVYLGKKEVRDAEEFLNEL